MSKLTKILFITSTILIILVISLNLLLTYIVNYIIHNADYSGPGAKNSKFVVNAKVSVFPWLKVGAFDGKYYYKNKPVMTVGNFFVRISILDLFNKQLTLKKIEIDDVVINLANFPKLDLKKQEMTESTSEHFEKSNTDKKKNTSGSNLFKFIHINELSLSNIKVIYHDRLKPIVIKSFRFIKNTGNGQYSIESVVEQNNQTINVSGSINTQKQEFLNLKVLLQNNFIAVVVKNLPNMITGEVTMNLPNRPRITALLMTSDEKIPNTLGFVFSIASQKLNISSFKVIYPNSFISGAAIIDGKATPVISLNITMNEQWVNTFINPNSTKCFIPYYVKEAMKVLNSNIKLTVVGQDQTQEQSQATVINIDLNGAHFNNLPIPTLENQLNLCFQ
jgi:hypothetical protein